MNHVDGDKEQYDDDRCVNYDRAQWMDIANPAAAQALDIEFFEKTDSGTDKNGIEDAKGDRASIGAGRQTRKRGKNHDFQQDRCQFASCRN
jgi:hypothetical protein